MAAGCFACDVLVGTGRALMSGMDLRGATLDHCQLRYADLSGADLSNATLRSCSLHAVNLTGAQLSGASFEGCMLREATLDQAVLAKTRWQACQLHSITGVSLHTRFLPPVPRLGFALNTPPSWRLPSLASPTCDCLCLGLPAPVCVHGACCPCTGATAAVSSTRTNTPHTPRVQTSRLAASPLTRALPPSDAELTCKAARCDAQGGKRCWTRPTCLMSTCKTPTCPRWCRVIGAPACRRRGWQDT